MSLDSILTGNGNGKGGTVRRVTAIVVTLGGGVLGWGIRDWVSHVNQHIDTANHGYERLTAVEVRAQRNEVRINELTQEIAELRRERRR